MKQFEFVEQLKASYPVARLCRIFGVSPRLPERLLGMAPTRARRARDRQRATANARLKERMVTIHTASRATYGAPRIQAELAHAELAAQGVHCGRKRVARLMRLAGVAGCHRRRRFATTQRDPARPCAPDLVKRAFVASSPDEWWVADITYVPTGQGFLFLAIVLDACSRRVVGWSMGRLMCAPSSSCAPSRWRCSTAVRRRG